MRFSAKLSGPWSFGQGLTVLISAMIGYTALSMAHLTFAKNVVGLEAYLGDGPRLPPILLIVSQTSKALALLGAVWFLAIKWSKLSWEAVGFRKVDRRWLVAAVLFAAVGFAFNILLAKTLVFALPDWASFTASRYGLDDGPLWQIAMLLVLTVLVTPFVEEVFFRGFLFQWMATYRPIWLAILVSSVMFGASHIIPPQIIAAAAFSLLIIYLFLASNSIWPAIVCHCVNNGLGVAFNMAAVAGVLPPALTPPS